MEKITPKMWSWASILEDQARAQIIQTAHMPHVQPYLAVMPDVHFGLGCSVGVAIPTIGSIFPAAVGVDIGCGMNAIRTRYTAPDLANRDLCILREAIEQAIPLSAGNYNQTLTATARGYVEELEQLAKQYETTGPGEVSPNWHLQLGTLGSGNHFIEICLDEEDRVWLFLHSGSRGVGNRLAQRHINIARQQCLGRSLPNRDLAYLVEGTPEFAGYMSDLMWAQRFAYLNRQEMMNRVKECFARYVGSDVTQLGVTEEVNCHHNYTEVSPTLALQIGEIPDLPGMTGTPHVWLSRKGAIDASEGVMGLIPGSMGTRSYVVVGKGCRDALNTAPHGAGRQYSRGAAKKEFTVEQLTEAMGGIEFNRDRAAKFIDEIPAAYKDVTQVMRDAEPLVTIRHTLRQIVNVKGD